MLLKGLPLLLLVPHFSDGEPHGVPAGLHPGDRLEARIHAVLDGVVARAVLVASTEPAEEADEWQTAEPDSPAHVMNQPELVHRAQHAGAVRRPGDGRGERVSERFKFGPAAVPSLPSVRPGRRGGVCGESGGGGACRGLSMAERRGGGAR